MVPYMTSMEHAGDYRHSPLGKSIDIDPFHRDVYKGHFKKSSPFLSFG